MLLCSFLTSGSSNPRHSFAPSLPKQFTENEQNDRWRLILHRQHPLVLLVVRDMQPVLSFAQQINLGQNNCREAEKPVSFSSHPAFFPPNTIA